MQTTAGALRHTDDLDAAADIGPHNQLGMPRHHATDGICAECALTTDTDIQTSQLNAFIRFESRRSELRTGARYISRESTELICVEAGCSLQSTTDFFSEQRTQQFLFAVLSQKGHFFFAVFHAAPRSVEICCVWLHQPLQIQG